MKKIAMLMMLLLVMVAGGCSNKEEADKVADKINAGQTLDAGDYTVMIAYIGNFAEKAQPIQDKIDNADGATPELDSQLAELKAGYPLVEEFSKAIQAAGPSTIGADNMSLLAKYAPLQWFDAPDWFVDDPDPAVAGEVVETPTSDTTGVIAGAVDKEVVK